MKHDTEREIVVGDEIELNIVEFNGNPVLETEFVQYDSELRTRDMKVQGIDKDDFRKCDEFDGQYYDGYISFRSVRIFHLGQREEIRLRAGDRIRTKIQSTYIAKGATKDNRRKIHIAVSDVRHVYHWTRNRAFQCLVLTLWCGQRLVKEKKIPVILKKGVRSDSGRVYPIIAEVLPDGSILNASVDTTRYTMTSGDYRLAERQKGRTMKDIDADFLSVPPFDRTIPTRDRRYLRHTHA